jgi:hypothetical protein
MKNSNLIIKVFGYIKSQAAIKFLSLTVGISCLFLFQNCENFGSFVAFDELSSSDPHKDSWKPVDGLEVKDGEWVKVEQQVEEKLRLTDRLYISSKLENIAIAGDETTAGNMAIQYQINSLVTRQINYFGGPCVYNNPESFRISSASNGLKTCNGVTISEVLMDPIPSASVYRSSSKQAICDYLASNANVQNNIKTNMEIVSDLLKSDNIPYLVHQLFYFGLEPRKRTLASLEDLYKAAAVTPAGQSDVSTLDNNSLKLVTLAVCHSNGWEAP